MSSPAFVAGAQIAIVMVQEAGLSRKVDDKKTKRALRRLERARKAAASDGEDTSKDLSEWEGEFLDSLEDRLETFGSAFADPDKGSLDEPLSARQALKLKEIEKKAKGKARKPMRRGNGFKRKGPPRQSRDRDINDDIIDVVPETPPEPALDRNAGAPETPPAQPAARPGTDRNAAKRPVFKLIDGGKSDDDA